MSLNLDNMFPLLLGSYYCSNDYCDELALYSNNHCHLCTNCVDLELYEENGGITPYPPYEEWPKNDQVSQREEMRDMLCSLTELFGKNADRVVEPAPAPASAPAPTLEETTVLMEPPKPVVFDYVDNPEKEMSHILRNGDHEWKLTITGSGINKGVSNIPTSHIYQIGDTQYNMKRYGYGQDSMGVMFLDNQAYFSIADGHGPIIQGKVLSYSAHKYVYDILVKNSDIVLNKIANGKSDELSILAKQWFKEVDDTLMWEDPHTSTFKHGGTTFTIIQKILDKNGILHTVIYNLGDSPCIKVDSSYDVPKLEEVTEDQNCDSMKWYEKYCNSCLDRQMEPADIYLNRFNYVQANGSCKRIPWVNGGVDPIIPFKKELVDGKYVVSDNVEVMRQFYEGSDSLYKPHLYAGGSQSERGKTANVEALRRGEYPMQNFGSTLRGVLQNIFGFGDKDDKISMNIGTEPHVSSYQSKSGTFEFVGSDGAFDPITDGDIRSIFSEGVTAKTMMDMINEKALEAQYPFKKTFSGEAIGRWDDVTFWIVKSEEIVKSPPKLEDGKWLTGC